MAQFKLAISVVLILFWSAWGMFIGRWCASEERAVGLRNTSWTAASLNVFMTFREACHVEKLENAELLILSTWNSLRENLSLIQVFPSLDNFWLHKKKSGHTGWSSLPVQVFFLQVQAHNVLQWTRELLLYLLSYSVLFIVKQTGCSCKMCLRVICRV